MVQENSNLTWLNIEQVLADISYFISGMWPQGKEIVLSGGGYAGSLVAWAANRYPQLVLGAYASCPYLDFTADFSEYDKGVWKQASLADTML